MIYMLGDSHTQSIGPRLKSILGDEFRFEAFPGYSTARADAARKLVPRDASTIILSLGGNDFGDQSAARTRLVSSLRAGNPSARFIWVGPYDSKDRTVAARHLAQALEQRDQFKNSSVRWIDGASWSSGLKHVADGTHFTADAYSTLASKIAETVSSSKTGFGLGILAALAGVGWWLWRRR